MAQFWGKFPSNIKACTSPPAGDDGPRFPNGCTLAVDIKKARKSGAALIPVSSISRQARLQAECIASICAPAGGRQRRKRAPQPGLGDMEGHLVVVPCFEEVNGQRGSGPLSSHRPPRFSANCRPPALSPPNWTAGGLRVWGRASRTRCLSRRPLPVGPPRAYMRRRIFPGNDRSRNHRSGSRFHSRHRRG
jgi:hypothetical protein